MQGHLNNRWLNSELISRTTPPYVNVRLDQSLDQNLEARRTTRLRSTTLSHRRMWQHLATSALLLGSLAFSYIAWSQTSNSVNPRIPIPGTVSELGGSSAGGNGNTDNNNTNNSGQTRDIRTIDSSRRDAGNA